MKKYHLFVIILLLIGCARPYDRYFKGLPEGVDKSNLIFSTEEPKVFRGNIDDPEADILTMIENGYALLGYSTFIGPKFNENQAIAKAKELKASAVVIYSKYVDTLTGVQPVILPDIKTSVSNVQVNAYGSRGYATAFGTGTTTTYGTQTIYTPYEIDRFEQGASYWAKKKGQLSGIVPNELPPELRRKIGSNKGVLVIAVVKRSPAFSADILRGDIIKKVNNIDIIDLKQYVQTMMANANKKVTITLLRDGKEIVKEIKLNTAPEGAEVNLIFLAK